ncbi:hypothetical protein SCLCIDRAFT_1207428 [Scleroderma citrinum Foug A]|uniref:Uncharacterized protein n=1 Tax=Scleroderma citrinum Foug A TaxID=1036808 RepID=A0A0C3EPR2_9AGAM|nr:hypothetical protein SCLCIDRAFT_1207428 [Scleroderma citrinum Foug A]
MADPTDVRNAPCGWNSPFFFPVQPFDPEIFHSIGALTLLPSPLVAIYESVLPGYPLGPQHLAFWRRLLRKEEPTRQPGRVPLPLRCPPKYTFVDLLHTHDRPRVQQLDQPFDGTWMDATPITMPRGVFIFEYV